MHDRVFVKNKSDHVKAISVTVLGEVNMPGVYPIAYKKTTLKEVIEYAGGMKPSAYLPLCIVFRFVDEEYTKKDINSFFILDP